MPSLPGSWMREGFPLRLKLPNMCSLAGLPDPDGAASRSGSIIRLPERRVARGLRAVAGSALEKPCLWRAPGEVLARCHPLW